MRLQQRVLREETVLVCFLSGSYGRGASDPFSDIDVALVYADDSARDTAYQKREQFVQSLMPYVPAKSFDAEHIRPYFHIALFSTGAKVDFRYETISDLKPSPWDHDIKLIKDTADWGRKFQQDAALTSAILPRPPFSDQALIKMDNQFWIMFMDAYRLLQRGDHDKAFPIYLEMLTFTFPSLRELLPKEDPARAKLASFHFDKDVPATIAHLRTVLNTYIEARSSVVRRYNLAFMPNEVFENGILRIISGSR
jgi:hypothetical protein